MNKKNNKKMLPLLLLALFMISIGAYGTRAYFTDNTSQKVGITLQLGNLSIASEESVWIYKGDNKHLEDYEAKETFDSADVKYLQPGDKFTRTFTFRNTGSLYQSVSVSEDFMKDVLATSPFEVTWIVGTTDLSADEIVLAPNDTVSATLTIEIPIDMAGLSGEYNESGSLNVKENEEFNLDLMGKTITAVAIQTNAE